MDLFLIRHADAVPLGQGDAHDDAQRQLTAEGEEQARRLAAGLQRKGVRFHRVLSSPLLRARQTAQEMLKDWSAPAPELIICDKLTPGTKPRKLAKALRDYGAESLALVGHQPDLGNWAGWLIGSRKARIDFAKAGVAHITGEGDPAKGGGTLVWLITHDWLRL